MAYGFYFWPMSRKTADTQWLRVNWFPYRGLHATAKITYKTILQDNLVSGYTSIIRFPVSTRNSVTSCFSVLATALPPPMSALPQVSVCAGGHPDPVVILRPFERWSVRRVAGGDLYRRDQLPGPGTTPAHGGRPSQNARTLHACAWKFDMTYTFVFLGVFIWDCLTCHIASIFFIFISINFLAINVLFVLLFFIYVLFL